LQQIGSSDDLPFCRKIVGSVPSIIRPGPI
jgi:hypothetical protein